jgi:uncharacterized membrane protein
MKKAGRIFFSLLVGLIYMMTIQAPVNRYLGLEDFTPLSLFINIVVLCGIIIFVFGLAIISRLLFVRIFYSSRFDMENRNRQQSVAETSRDTEH